MQRSTTAPGSATDLGELGNGIKRVTGNSLDAENDEDWLKLSVSSSGKISVLLEPIGFAVLGRPSKWHACGRRYQEQSGFGIQAPGLGWIGTGQCFGRRGLGQNEELIDFELPAGGDYFLQVTGTGAKTTTL